jgi:hypothetical protein
MSSCGLRLGARCARAFIPAVVLAALAACATARPPAAARLGPAARFDLAGFFSIPPLTRFPPIIGVPVGGLSGLARGERDGEFYAISDDREGSRVLVIRLAGEGASLRAEVLDAIPLQGGADVPPLDPEGIVLTREGRLFVSSEGIGNEEPRIAPAIVEYTSRGAFVRTLPVRERFVPNPAGVQTRGVRPNFGFEALTIAPGGDRLFTATETAIVQDGEPVGFDRGARARLLEYRASGGGFEPRREFIYPLEPMAKVDFAPGLSVAGLVELLALTETDLLALERTYIEEAGTGRGINRARLFRITIDGASDVSTMESLQAVDGLIPVQKTLLLDVAGLSGLPSELATLDNFEGLAFGEPLADGTPSLVMVSDDNFNESQRSWFLLLGIK